jgi:hypothetical protein
MSVQALEGFVENGVIRLRDAAALPEKTEVIVVVVGEGRRVPVIRSPRLVNKEDAALFVKEVTEVVKDDSV